MIDCISLSVTKVKRLVPEAPALCTSVIKAKAKQEPTFAILYCVVIFFSSCLPYNFSMGHVRETTSCYKEDRCQGSVGETEGMCPCESRCKSFNSSMPVVCLPAISYFRRGIRRKKWCLGQVLCGYGATRYRSHMRASTCFVSNFIC